MSLIKKSFLTFLSAILIFGFVACEKEGPMEKAGKKADQAMEETKESVEEATEDVKKKME